MDANEWTTDDDDDADREAGSLVVRNKKAQRVKNPNLGNLFAAGILFDLYFARVKYPPLRSVERHG